MQSAIFIAKGTSMKRLFLLLVTSLIAIQLYSQDNTIPPVRLSGPIQPFNMGIDKVLHFATSYTIAYTTYHYLQPRIGSRRARIWGAGISLGVGIAKEVIDERYRKGYEQGDIIANMAGILLFRIDIPLSK
tara:strand:+ start:160 stop:552 length:393 start_codon:yes stop_codon:yes gene_type:complete